MKSFFNKVSLALGVMIVSPVSSTKLLNSYNFKETIESGQNGMVKFHQPWCGHCRNMKKAWDELSDISCASVFIADVDCSKEQELCEANDVTGYPTIYYYKDGVRETYTGGRGLEVMNTFVIENLQAVCNPNKKNLEDICSEKAIRYIMKWKDREEDMLKKEILRLQNMLEKDMTEDLLDWIKQRISILQQMVDVEPLSMMEFVSELAIEFKDSVTYTSNLAYDLLADIYKVSSKTAFNIKESIVDTIFPDPRIPEFITVWKEKRIFYVKKEIWRLQKEMIDKKAEDIKWNHQRIAILKDMQRSLEEPDL